MLSRLGATLALLMLFTPAAPHAVRAESGDVPSGTVAVFAAASLTEAFRAVGAELRTVHPGLTLQFNFAGSPTLATQIEQGAPADVFASADEATMQRLADAHLLARPAAVFARNRLTIAVPAGNPKHVSGLADLGRPGLVLALCDPAIPAGRYASEAFGKAGVRVPEASREADVKAVLGKVLLGEVDAGIVYVTDVPTGHQKVQAVEIPLDQNVVARYPVAVLANAQNRSGAEEFVAFVLSETGQRILARFGFAGR